MNPRCPMRRSGENGRSHLLAFACTDPRNFSEMRRDDAEAARARAGPRTTWMSKPGMMSRSGATSATVSNTSRNAADGMHLHPCDFETHHIRVYVQMGRCERQHDSEHETPDDVRHRKNPPRCNTSQHGILSSIALQKETYLRPPRNVHNSRSPNLPFAKLLSNTSALCNLRSSNF